MRQEYQEDRKEPYPVNFRKIVLIGGDALKLLV
jgi:hypothetical protein